ncbi:hypothetical protein CVIRNUC_006908 [Coccomyxa viridis]|uniref:Nuclease associated modular domain-containing protein n=1 Tax=Coccomyxa viridis TaxID=1274662 RepID=A0AAV1ICL3_9CHLO|nr:hypothetical protein CVIRNUC_006908 [Coccomyxa viridis]
MPASNSKDHLKQDLDRERGLWSSSGAESSERVPQTASQPETAAIALTSLSETAESPPSSAETPASYYPPKERLRRMREEQYESLDESDRISEKERLRRLRISQANRGRMPWNVGRKHKPETIALIRRRTKEVMNQPEMIAWLKATHKPQLHDMDVRARISLGVRLAQLRKKAGITSDMTAKEVEAALKHAKADSEAEAEAQRLQKEKAAEERRLKRESQALDKQQLKQQLRQQLKIQQKQERQRLARATAEALTKAAKASKATKASKGKGQSKTASRRGRKPAVSHEQAAEMAEEESARQQQLQKALQLALRLEDALSTCKANVEGLEQSGDISAIEHAQEVMANAVSHLVRVKGQVAHLQSGLTPNQQFSEEEAASLARMMELEHRRHELHRHQQALADNQQCRSSADDSAKSAFSVGHPVLDVEAHTSQ